MLSRRVSDELLATLGSAVSASASLSGGDINDAFRVELADGRTVFVKTNSQSPQGMFEAEARGLSWLSVAAALSTPAVLAYGDGSAAFLALEYLPDTPRAAGFDEALGRGLAALHQAMPKEFGLDQDNFIGILRQDNTPHRCWSEFYAERRLLPQLALGRDRGRIGSPLARKLEQVCARLPELVGPSEAPARLHGDLWSGNLHVGPRGEPVLIDPAAYAGHREVDLAMMRLFGGFSARVFSSYHEAFPLASGHEERVPLYQLYPLLAHANLFGGSYVGSVERALSGLL